MSEALVERRLQLDRTAEVLLQFLPPAPDGDDCRCEFCIVWPDRTETKRAMGVDPIQSLLLAMEMAHVWLLASPEGRSGRLSWLDGKDLGLPLPSAVKREDFA
jgi:hypothetical protein